MALQRPSAKTINGRPLGTVGYGLMGLTMPWAPIEYPVAAKLMARALDHGANFWNGGTFYGTPTANSLHLLKHYFTQHPEDASSVVLSIKGALTPQRQPAGDRASLRTAVQDAVDVLGSAKKIDVFEMARVDPEVPIETSVRALAEMVAEGLIGGIGLSEVSAETIRRAHAVHAISAVEVELSLFTPEPLRNGIVETCRELDIPLIAYSPISRGWLADTLRNPSDLAPTDYRNALPRFQSAAFAQNVKLVEAVEAVAKRKSTTTAQVAIGWVCAQGAIPIPGSKNEERVLQNCSPAQLSEEDMAELQRAIEEFPVSGQRYGGDQQRLLNG